MNKGSHIIAIEPQGKAIYSESLIPFQEMDVISRSETHIVTQSSGEIYILKVVEDRGSNAQVERLKVSKVASFPIAKIRS